MSEEEKTIIDFLKKCKENKDKLIPLLQQSNETLLNYIDKINNQLQQKENIIKEAREYIKNYPTLRYSSMDNSNGNRLTGKLVPTDKLLEILDKVKES